jgi:hypothetical protein
MTKQPALPAGIIEGDLKRPPYVSDNPVPWEDRTFELWHTTAFGWCIPTLLIGRARGAQTDRTYAISVTSKQAVRIGKGPHVTRTVIVYVTAKRLKALQPFLDLRAQGAARAGEIRDRISSRRAQGQEMRAQGRRSWRWDV